MANSSSIIYDEQGHPRHFRYPPGTSDAFADAAGGAQDVAKNFLKAQAEVLRVPQETMHSLDVRAAPAPLREDESLRFESEERVMDSTVVSYAQTMFGLPIHEAGISVTVNTPDNSVRAATSTLHYDIA